MDTHTRGNSSTKAEPIAAGADAANGRRGPSNGVRREVSGAVETEVEGYWLNLGCGRRRLPGFVNVDSELTEHPDRVVDLGKKPWPWQDNEVDGAVASHILEHLPGESFFNFMQELYRVCKPGAEVHVVLPWPKHDLFINDPSHYRAVTPTTLILFSPRYIAELERDKGLFLTDFGTRYGVNFELGKKITYTFDEGVSMDDPDFEWMCKHLNNVIKEWRGVMKVIK